MGASLNNIHQYIRMQYNSDRQMSMVWLLVYIFPITVSIIAVGYIIASISDIFSSIDFANPQLYSYSYDWVPQEFVFIWILVVLSGVINLVISIVLNYLLVNRRHTHFQRQKLLSENIITAISYLAKSKDRNIEGSLTSLEKILKEANSEETEKSPTLWAILSVFVPLIQFYVYYFLMKDLYKHEHREDNFWQNVKGVLKMLDTDFSIPKRNEPIPDRSFVLYLILTVVTGGLFIVYWLFVLLKDPNDHFKYHVSSENQLLVTLESVII